MPIILTLVGIVIVTAGGVYLVGRSLPVGHVASGSRQFSQSPQQVWDAISDYAGYALWRKGLKGVIVLADKDGHPRWQEKSGWGDSITFMEVERRAPENLVVRIDDDKQPFGGTWTYELMPQNGGTLLKITENGEVYNPVFRFVSHYIMDQSKTIRDVLTALEAHLVVK